MHLWPQVLICMCSQRNLPNQMKWLSGTPRQWHVISLNFLSWYSILYYFQVYSIVVRHLFNLWSDPPISLVPTLHHTQLIAILLTIFPMLCFTFSNCQLILLNSSFSPKVPTPLPPGNHHIILCIYEYVSILFVHVFRFHI